MSVNSIRTPFPVFTDTNGLPLEDGYAYIGEVDKNPEIHTASVYWDADMTIPAAQPIRTIGGYPSRSGTPSSVYVQGEYSITVKDKNLLTMYTSLSTSGVLSSMNSLSSVVSLIGLESYPENTSINISGYTTANDGGGGIFNWDSTIDKSTANIGTIIDPSVSLALQGTGVGNGCWVRQYGNNINPKYFGAKGVVGGVLQDDTTALQAYFDFMATLSENLGEKVGYVQCDLDSTTYGISSPILINNIVQGVNISNGGFKAIDDGNWTDLNAMFEVSKGRWMTFDTVIIDGAKVANIFHMQDSVAQFTLQNVNAYRYRLFGLKCDGGYQLRMHRSGFAQFRTSDAEYKIQASRTGYGVWSIGKGDMEIVDSIIECALYPVYIQGGANFRLYDNHIFNGSNDDAVLFSEGVNIKIEEGSNTHDIFIRGNYIDNGKIETDNVSNLMIDGNEFYNNGLRQTLSEFIKLIASSASQDAFGLKIGDTNRKKIENASEFPLVTLDHTSGTWDLNKTMIESANHDISTVSQTDGKTLVQTKTGVATVLSMVTNATRAISRYYSSATNMITGYGAEGNDAIIVTNNTVRQRIYEDGAVRVYSDYVVDSFTTGTTVMEDTDSGKIVYKQQGAVASTVELPNTLPIGWHITFVNKGSGTLTLSAQSGASLNGTLAGSVVIPQYSSYRVECVANTGTDAEFYKL